MPQTVYEVTIPAPPVVLQKVRAENDNENDASDDDDDGNDNDTDIDDCSAGTPLYHLTWACPPANHHQHNDNNDRKIPSSSSCSRGLCKVVGEGGDFGGGGGSEYLAESSVGVRGGDGDGSGDDDVRDTDVRDPRDVDGGWAWVVLVASCLILTIQESIWSVTGMFQVEFQVALHSSRGFLALIGAAFLTLSGILGPVAGMLSQVLTNRVTLMLGSVMTTCGLMAASYVTSAPALLLTYGLLGGVGNALTFTPNVTLYSAYFRKFRQMANGLIQACSGVGMLLGPFLARRFLDRHGWRFSLAACAFLTAQICVLGALLFPRPGSRPAARVRRLTTRMIPRCLQLQEQQQQQPDSRKKKTKKKKTKRREGESVVVDNINTDTKLDLEEEEQEMTSLKEAGVDGAISSEKKKDTLTARERLLGDEEEGVKEESDGGDSLRRKVWVVVSTRRVWVVCMSQMLLMAGYNIELLHQPSFINALDPSLSDDFPALFLSFGLAILAIRVVGGLVFTRVREVYLVPAIFLSQLTMALALGLLPFYGVSLSALFFFNVVTGASVGLGFGLAAPVMISLIGGDLLPIAYGLMLMFCGSCSAMMASLAGGLNFTGALILLLLMCFRCQKKDNS